MTIEVIKLREQMAQLATEARKEYDKITDKTSESEVREIEGRFDSIMADHDKLQAKAERLEKLSSAEARANAGDPRRPRSNEEARAVADDAVSAPEYKEVFAKAVRFGTGALDSEERSVLMTGRDKEARAQSTSTDSAGGYIVPEGFSGELEKALVAWGPMYDATIVREMVTSNGISIPWPTVDDTSNTGDLKAENAAATDDGTDDVAFGQKQLDAYVYSTKIVRVPMELLEDSFFNMEALLTDLFAERLGRLANTVLTTGDGTNKPNGIVTASSLGKTAAATGAITSDELIDLVHSVDPAYRASPKCRFMFNDTTLASIRKLKDGQGNYLWQMGDVRSGEPSLILGHQYSVNQAMASIGVSAKPVLFGDFSKYVVRKVNGFSLMTLRERYAEHFQVGMVAFKRFDGELLNTAAVKHLVNAAV